MANIIKTIEQLSYSHTSGDLWDEMNRDLGNLRLVLNFVQGNSYTLRMLGPFMGIFRFYIPNALKMDNRIDIMGIADYNNNAIENARKIIKELHDSRKISTAVFTASEQFLSDIACYTDKVSLWKRHKTWQKCVMVNALIKSGDAPSEPQIKVITLNRMLGNSLLQKTNGNPKTKINGIYAHDISISRGGTTLKPIYTISDFKAPTHLTDKEVEYLMANGLIDIPSLIKDINGRSNSRYFYKINEGYKMPEEFISILMKEMKIKEEEKHLLQVEEELTDIPIDAFENSKKMRESIGSLEV